MVVNKNWICNHLGARAHYEIPKALWLGGNLKYLLTEYWAPEGRNTVQAKIPLLKKLQQRRNDVIPDEIVRSFNLRALSFEVNARLMRKHGWDLIISRNNWYQKHITKILHQLDLTSDNVFFSFAYTALEPMRYTSGRKIKNILYQMDPGLYEEKLVAEEYRKMGINASGWEKAPASYWQNWKEECELSDTILVNSGWSREALVAEGIDDRKIVVLPLPYTIPAVATSYKKEYPDRFTVYRPLRVLFLGTLTVRKGFHRVLEVARQMEGKAVEFYFVGQKEFEFQLPAGARYVPHVSREETADYYRMADVFLFPTLSDGFGLTQLEAFAWQLPIISSRFCGEVVTHDRNGLIMKDNSVQEMVQILSELVNAPERLAEFSANTLENFEKFSHANFVKGLIQP